MKREIKPGVKLFRPLAMDGMELKSVDEKTRTIWHPVTGEVADRYGDIVRIDGINIDQFVKKPAVLYGHDYQSSNPVPVIGRNVGFEKKGNLLYAGTQFLSVDTPGMSQGLKDLVNDNWLLHVEKLLGWSIGFMVDEWTEFKEEGVRGYDFKKITLIEYSSVVIPAHQDAVNDAVKGGRISGAVVKYFDLGKTDPEERPAHASPDAGIVTVKADPEKPEEPGFRGLSPDPIDHPELASAPAPESHEEHTIGGSMLEKILDKLNKGEELTKDEKDYLAKARLAIAPEKPADPPAPVRRLELLDGPATRTKHMSEIMELPTARLGDQEREMRAFADDAYIVASILRADPRKTKFWTERQGLSSALRKAMDAATATEGAEWIPTALSQDYIEKFRLQAKVAALFDDVTMPTNPFKLPYAGGLSASNFYLVGESTSDSPTASPASTMATGDQTLTAKKLKARLLWSDEFDEDSILAVLPILRSELVVGGAEAVEDCIINGDTTATHMDSDVTDSKDRRKIWDGLRDQCPSGTKVDLGTFATSTLLSILTKMGKYAVNPNELAFITGARGYNYLRNLTETLTVDKYGAQATILNGELGKLAGVPIIISEYIRENLNASAVYDGSTTDNTIILVVNRRALILGTRGGVKLTFKNEGEVDQNQLIMSFRKALAYRWTPSSTVTTIGLAYNVAV